jgi:hypothetical protein
MFWAFKYAVIMYEIIRAFQNVLMWKIRPDFMTTQNTDDEVQN